MHDNKTRQLVLKPASADMLLAELSDKTLFAKMLKATVPESWPPEAMTDAYPWFLSELEKHPNDEAWYVWYALLPASEQGTNILVGSGGFKGAPDENGQVEIGYSVLPEFQGRNFATEMIAALVDLAFSVEAVRLVFAETTADNAASIRVLRKNNFEEYAREGEAVFLRRYK